MSANIEAGGRKCPPGYGWGSEYVLGADACIAFDGTPSKYTTLYSMCINVTSGLTPLCDLHSYFCIKPEIQLQSDGCIEITDEQNSNMKDGKTLKRICTCSTNGCDPLNPKTGFYLFLNYFVVMDILPCYLSFFY